MDCQIETELHGELLLVTWTGRVDLDSSLESLRQVFNIAAEKRVLKVLINGLTLSGVLSILERYELAMGVRANLVQLGISPRVAFVGIPPTFNGFAAQVGKKRGVFSEVFPTIEKALDWLGCPTLTAF